ncbi:unnamed protein product [Ilex paraguariensis]|uniref:Cystatin domain-containing protein n=1 Tax=Ilex paraguariensis TaxID=185542 RepID=A0ABC8RB54_9AQUA
MEDNDNDDDGEEGDDNDNDNDDNNDHRGEKKEKKTYYNEDSDFQLRDTDMTEEEYDRYKKQIESEGFDVEEFPDKIEMCMIRPILGFDEDPTLTLIVNTCSAQAIAKYNVENVYTGYQLVKVLKVNVQIVAGMLLFANFEAKDTAAADGVQSSNIFQSMVFHSME